MLKTTKIFLLFFLFQLITPAKALWPVEKLWWTIIAIDLLIFLIACLTIVCIYYFDCNKNDNNPQLVGPNPGAQNPGAQNPGAQNPVAQNPGGQNPGAQNPGGQNPGAQNPGAQNIGGQNQGQNPGRQNNWLTWENVVVAAANIISGATAGLSNVQTSTHFTQLTYSLILGISEGAIFILFFFAFGQQCCCKDSKEPNVWKNRIKFVVGWIIAGFAIFIGIFFRLTNIADKPEIFPGNQSFDYDLNISLYCKPFTNCTIYQTKNGPEPSEISEKYDKDIRIFSDTTILAIAYSEGMEPSDIATGIYKKKITNVVGIPTISPDTILFPSYEPISKEVKIKMACDTPGADIRQTINAWEPDLNSPLYTGPIMFQQDNFQTIKMKAFQNNQESSVVTKNYISTTNGNAAPLFSPDEGTFPNDIQIIITCAIKIFDIQYTTDKKEPTETSKYQRGAIDLRENGKTLTLKAICLKNGFSSSSSVASYQLKQKASQPTFNPKPGDFTTDINVEISCSTSDARIYYTLDGTTPDINSIYQNGNAIPITKTTNIKAIAIKEGIEPSDIERAVFAIKLPKPVLSQPGGAQWASLQISITCAACPNDADIQYTTDGTIPSSTSQKQVSLINIPRLSKTYTFTIKAISFNNLKGASDVVIENQTMSTSAQIVSVTKIENQTMAVNLNGNLYICGSFFGAVVKNYGNGVVTTGTSNGNNMQLIKQTKDFTPVWVKGVSSSSQGESELKQIATANNNIVVAGYLYTTSNLNIGNGIILTGKSTSRCPVIIKYSESGLPLQGKVFPSSINIQAISVDKTNENVYVAGSLFGSSLVDIGNGITAQCKGSAHNYFLMNLDNDGIVKFANCIDSEDGSGFNIITTENGYIWVGGYFYQGLQILGSGVGIPIKYEGFVIAKFHSSGIAQWAGQVTVENGEANFTSIDADANENIQIVGAINCNTKDITKKAKADLQNNIELTSLCVYGQTIAIAKIDKDGTTIWGKSLYDSGDTGWHGGTNSSSFLSLKIDSSGNIQAGGFVTAGYFNFGNGVSQKGRGYDMVLVKYDNNGEAQWASSVTGSIEPSSIATVDFDNSGNFIFVTAVFEKGTYNFGIGGTKTFVSEHNILILKYAEN